MQNDMLDYSNPPQTGPIHFQLKDPRYNLTFCIWWMEIIFVINIKPRMLSIELSLSRTHNIPLYSLAVKHQTLSWVK